MKKCDVCEGPTKELTTLKDEYCIENVDEVCGDCLKVISSFHSKVNSVLLDVWTSSRDNAVKKFIAKMKTRVGKMGGY